jgi:hypothetical protein
MVNTAERQHPAPHRSHTTNQILNVAAPSTRAQRAAAGKAARSEAPLEAHAQLTPDVLRNPVGLLMSQSVSRVPELVPVRHGRMLVDIFLGVAADDRSGRS